MKIHHFGWSFAVAALALCCFAQSAHAQCKADLVADGVVDGADLAALLTA